MTRFTSNEWQTINVSFTFVYECDSFGLDERIAEAVIDAADAPVDHWDIDDTNIPSDEHLLCDVDIEYYIKLRVAVNVAGTCDYDPGRYYGPMENCYPAEVSDVEYESGMITDIDELQVLNHMPELLDITVDIDEVDGDGELEIED